MNPQMKHSDRYKKVFKTTNVALVMLAMAASPLQANELNGVEFTGYTRGGAYFASAEMPKGGYTLGGDLQKYRLGNEGDNGIEIGLGKSVEVGEGKKWSMQFMPAVWGGKFGTAQAYAAISGLDFAPEAKFWAGQRRLRIQDVHIVDHFLMDYGENTGAGVTDYNLGFAKLGMGVFNAGNFDGAANPNNANRINFDLSDIQTSEKGSLRLLLTVVSGKFQFGSPGAGLSVLHNQSDFVLTGLTNSIFLQSATGHAALSGKFQGLGDVASGGTEQPGQHSMRIADAINWQGGAIGGQAMIAYQTAKIDGGINHGVTTRDFSFGGRVSYALNSNFKMLGEAGSTSRSIDGQAQQRLNKYTLAPTLALAPEFWSRPELRFYVTYASWNDAAAVANSGVGGFGVGGRTSSTIAGAQIEAWW